MKKAGIDFETGKIWATVERKVNLGNYQSITYVVGASIENPYDEENISAIKVTAGNLLNSLEKTIEEKIKGE